MSTYLRIAFTLILVLLATALASTPTPLTCLERGDYGEWITVGRFYSEGLGSESINVTMYVVFKEEVNGNYTCNVTLIDNVEGRRNSSERSWDKHAVGAPIIAPEWDENDRWFEEHYRELAEVIRRALVESLNVSPDQVEVNVCKIGPWNDPPIYTDFLHVIRVRCYGVRGHVYVLSPEGDVALDITVERVVVKYAMKSGVMLYAEVITSGDVELNITTKLVETSIPCEEIDMGRLALLCAGVGCGVVVFVVAVILISRRVRRGLELQPRRTFGGSS